MCLLISSIKKTDNSFEVIGFLDLTIVYALIHVIHLDRFQRLLEWHEQYPVHDQD